MNHVKKILLVGVFIQALVSSAFANCDKHIKAMAVVDAIEKYEAHLGYIAEPGYTTFKKDLEEYKFMCPTADRLQSVSIHLSLVGFCMSLANETLASAQNINLIKTKNAKHQAKLEKALYEFGQLFKSAQDDQNSFTCELKNIVFPTL